MRITAFPSLTEQQFLGCTSAFVDSLFGELNAAVMYLRKLENQPKGSAFSYEMSLDQHRYGALVVLDRWATLVDAFGTHLDLGANQRIIDEAAGRVQTAENLLGRANELLDAVGQYSGEIVAACVMSFQTLRATFDQEREAAGRAMQLGPLLPEEFREARRVFFEDLSAR